MHIRRVFDTSLCHVVVSPRHSCVKLLCVLSLADASAGTAAAAALSSTGGQSTGGTETVAADQLGAAVANDADVAVAVHMHVELMLHSRFA